MSAASPSKPPPRLLDLVRQQTRLLHYSLRTEEAYVHWVRAFVRYHGLRHPSELAGPDITAFLTWLAHDRQAAPGTHRQALSALLFLYQKVLRQPVPWVDEIGHPKGERRLPVVMSVDEVAAVLEQHAQGGHGKGRGTHENDAKGFTHQKRFMDSMIYSGRCLISL